MRYPLREDRPFKPNRQIQSEQFYRVTLDAGGPQAMKTAREVRKEWEKDPELLRQRLQFARWGTGIFAGATFASILAAVALQVTGTQVQAALVLLVLALPLLCQYTIMVTDPRRHYHPSWLNRLAPLAGVLLFIAGFAYLLFAVNPPACLAWVVAVIICGLSCANAEIRGYERLAAGKPHCLPPHSP